MPTDKKMDKNGRDCNSFKYIIKMYKINLQEECMTFFCIFYIMYFIRSGKIKIKLSGVKTQKSSDSNEEHHKCQIFKFD